ncbi:unnamed protein product [Polarella glacialis]|uniref:Uncharacterized protein n=1 Tax=Polarella glacialis TaxID=89957 RepID=A0A813HW56_POLGL|nr:unnamed protein product [Polarella glacialis]
MCTPSVPARLYPRLIASSNRRIADYPGHWWMIRGCAEGTAKEDRPIATSILPSYQLLQGNAHAESGKRMHQQCLTIATLCVSFLPSKAEATMPVVST